jgi:uncharacterized protein YuzB (UPF0349 family)
MKDMVVNVIEYGALLFLGIIMVLIFAHLLNGTLGSWIDAKFHAKQV